ncbi:hypothetical protein FOVSG1_007897 [Fusarium oxysporum f. sp. vasinfectum]
MDTVRCENRICITCSMIDCATVQRNRDGTYDFSTFLMKDQGLAPPTSEKAARPGRVKEETQVIPGNEV